MAIDRAPFVVLREKAKLVGEIGRVHLLLAEHLHEVRLRHIDDPLHVLGRIETRLLQNPCATLILVDAAKRADADPLALELGEIGQRIERPDRTCS